jgi:D-threo-aldose 1-dehydrogenase
MPIAPEGDGAPEIPARVLLGGLSISELGLGGGALGGSYDRVPGDRVPREAACRAVEAAYAGGIRYFDTAPIYGHGRSEERVGAALSERLRSRFVLSSKVGIAIEPLEDQDAEEGYAELVALDWRYDFSYDGALRSIEGSLQRLQTDRIDIAFVHDPDEGDSALPPAQRRNVSRFREVIEGAYPALARLKDEGTIEAVGVGMNGYELLTEFAEAAHFDCFLLAGRYTLLEQAPLEDFLPMCEQQEISVIIGGVFNSGILASGSAAPTPLYNYVPAEADVI